MSIGIFTICCIIYRLEKFVIEVYYPVDLDLRGARIPMCTSSNADKYSFIVHAPLFI